MMFTKELPLVWGRLHGMEYRESYLLSCWSLDLSNPKTADRSELTAVFIVDVSESGISRGCISIRVSGLVGESGSVVIYTSSN